MRYPEKMELMFAGVLLQPEKKAKTSFKRIRLIRSDLCANILGTKANYTEILEASNSDDVENSIIVNQAYLDKHKFQQDNPLAKHKVIEKISDMDNYEVFGEELSDETPTETEHITLMDDEIDIKMENIDSESEVLNQEQLLEMEMEDTFGEMEMEDTSERGMIS